MPLFLGFLLPLVLLLQMTLQNARQTLDDRFWGFATNSFILAAITAALALVIALLMAYGLRLRSNFGMRAAVRIASMGYAVPGSVDAGSEGVNPKILNRTKVIQSFH